MDPLAILNLWQGRYAAQVCELDAQVVMRDLVHLNLPVVERIIFARQADEHRISPLLSSSVNAFDFMLTLNSGYAHQMRTMSARKSPCFSIVVGWSVRLARNSQSAEASLSFFESYLSCRHLLCRRPEYDWI